MSDDKNSKKPENISDSTKDFLKEKKRSDKTLDRKNAKDQGNIKEGKNFRR